MVNQNRNVQASSTTSITIFNMVILHAFEIESRLLLTKRGLLRDWRGAVSVGTPYHTHSWRASPSNHAHRCSTSDTLSMPITLRFAPVEQESAGCLDLDGFS